MANDATAELGKIARSSSIKSKWPRNAFIGSKFGGQDDVVHTYIHTYVLLTSYQIELHYLNVISNV